MLYNVPIKDAAILRDDYSKLTITVLNTNDASILTSTAEPISKILTFEQLISQIIAILNSNGCPRNSEEIMYMVFKYIESVTSSLFTRYIGEISIDYNDYELTDSVISDINIITVIN